jgi:hypothetical protein
MKGIKIPAEVYSRVSGYYRPVSQWNKGKQSEFKDRKVTLLNDDIKVKKGKVPS